MPGDTFLSGACTHIPLAPKYVATPLQSDQKPESGSPKHKWAQWFYERNTVVSKESEPDTVVIACVSPDRKGGTEDTLRKVQRHLGKDYDGNLIRIV